MDLVRVDFALVPDEPLFGSVVCASQAITDEFYYNENVIDDKTGVPVEAADRNLAALQADMLGAHALGLRMVVCRTGSPRVAGDYPSAGSGSPWDVDSVGLVSLLAALNEGIDWRGVAIAEQTRFVIGATLGTAVGDLAHVLEKAEAAVCASRRPAQPGQPRADR